MKSMHDSLLLLNIPRTVASVIEVLSDNNPHTLREIEREADLRQPEVSIAVDALSAYLVVGTRKKPGKGRSQKVVTMTKAGFHKCIDNSVKGFKNNYFLAISVAEELKNKW